jgi:hypothetical protein
MHRKARRKRSNSHFDSERAHPGRSAQRNPNAASYSAPFSLSGSAAAWKAALHARQNETASILVAHCAHEPERDVHAASPLETSGPLEVEAA